MVIDFTTKEILFLYPKTDEDPFYLNPIEMQRLGSIIKVNFSDNKTIMLDLRVPSDHQTWKNFSEVPSVVCIATPAGSVVEVSNLVQQCVLLGIQDVILFGETVTDGLTEKFLRGLDVRGINLWAFIGRNEEEFSEVMHSVLCKYAISHRIQSTALLDTEGKYHESIPKQLPKIVKNYQVTFPQTILEHIAFRGLQILLDGITRGCEHRCGYCHLNNSPTTSGHIQYVTSTNISSIVYLSQNIQRRILIQFSDENFFGGYSDTEKLYRFARIKDLSKDIKASGFSGYIGVDTRCDTILDLKETYEMTQQRAAAWESMYSVGLRYAYLGIETFAPLQSKRYAKALDLSIVPAALEILKKRGISFTVGLIAVDPLMTPDDIRKNINYIEANDLYGNIASLLKEMRVHLRSPYYKLLQQKMGYEDRKADNFVYLNTNELKYFDEAISLVIPSIRKVHRLFSQSGYRHSDVAAYEVLKTPSGALSNSIPYVIGKMECQVWSYLLKNNPQGTYSSKDLLEIIYDATSESKKILEQMAIQLGQQQALLVYYRKVFNKISQNAKATLMSTLP